MTFSPERNFQTTPTLTVGESTGVWCLDLATVPDRVTVDVSAFSDETKLSGIPFAGTDGSRQLLSTALSRKRGTDLMAGRASLLPGTCSVAF